MALARSRCITSSPKCCRDSNRSGKVRNLVLEVPRNSPSAQEMFSATAAWFPRPFVARQFTCATAVTCGQRDSLGPPKKFTVQQLKEGVPSRPHVQVMRWTGWDNGEEQEYALLRTTHARGENLPHNEPAGTLGADDPLA